jgi:myosin heavy subunit
MTWLGSRFGKWMEVKFDDSGRILGASNTSYLLEKSR